MMNPKVKKYGWIVGVSVGVVLLVTFILSFPGITYFEVGPITPEMQEDDAVLMVLAYPEAICRTTEAAYSNLLPLIGIGKKQLIRAGHACLIIAREGCAKLEYFDNGRYIAPEGFCRVRGENTDPELKMDVQAVWDGKKLVNIEEILLWLYAHPEKTHGAGTLYAGVVEKANYEAAIRCVKLIQDQEIIEYGPFASDATNCARFVTDVIYNGSLDPKLKKQIRRLYKFTPSGLSNIGAANTYDHFYYVDQSGLHVSDKSLNWIQVKVLFDGGKGYQDYSTSGTLCPPEGMEADENWQWLGGLGYGAWYELRPAEEGDSFIGSCYTSAGKLNYRAVYHSSVPLELSDDFKITYPSHFRRITIIQDGKEYALEKVENLIPAI